MQTRRVVILVKGLIKWNLLKMPVASIIWLVTAWAMLYVSFDKVSSYYYIGFGLLSVLFFIVTDRTAFFYYVTLTLVTVFYFLFLAFKDGWGPFEQAIGIGLHFAFLLHLFALYSLSKYVYQFRSENQILKTRILQLEEYILREGILTKREFEKQTTFILSTMARREETGFYIRIDFSQMNRTVRKRLLLTLADILYSVLRKNFDLVGQYDDKTLVVLLQNTDEHGYEIAKGRLLKIVYDQLEEGVIEKVKWSIYKIDGQKRLDELEVLE